MVSDYYESLDQLRTLKIQMRALANAPVYSLRFPQPGRLVRLLSDAVDRDLYNEESAEASSDGDEESEEEILGLRNYGVWAVIVNFEKLSQPSNRADGIQSLVLRKDLDNYTVDVLVYCG